MSGGWAALAEIGSKLGEFGLNQASANQAQNWSKANEQVAWDRFKHRYQATVEDMRLAGLNPVLAATGGFNVGGSVPQATSFPGKQSTPMNFTGSALQIQEANKAEAETLNVNANTQVQWQSVQESFERIAKMRQESKLYSQQEKESVQKVNNLHNEIMFTLKKIEEIEQNIREVSARTSLEQQQMELTKIQTEQVKANKRLLVEQANKILYEMEKLKKESLVYRGPAGKIITYVKEIMDSLNLHFVLTPGAFK